MTKFKKKTRHKGAVDLIRAIENSPFLETASVFLVELLLTISHVWYQNTQNHKLEFLR